MFYNHFTTSQEAPRLLFNLQPSRNMEIFTLQSVRQAKRKHLLGASSVDHILPITLGFILLFIVIEFCFAMYNMALLTKAAQEAGRVASLYWEDPNNPGVRKLRSDIKEVASRWTNLIVNFSDEIPSVSVCWYSVDSTIDPANCQEPTGSETIKSGDSVLIRSNFKYNGPITSKIFHLKFDVDLGKVSYVRVE